ncbi:MAG: LAGLIDADG family homing endonuclease [Candidatus Aenigmatarchaeota archaeon]
MEINEIYLDSELAELIGAFIGDGFIGRYGGSYHVEFVGNIKLDRDYLMYLSNIITSHFNVKPRTVIHAGAIRLIITYKELHTFFKNIGFTDGIKNKSVSIPENLLNSDLIKHLVRGLFDTDGYLFIDRRKIYKTPYVRIGLSTKSQLLFQQMKSLLIENGYKLYTRVDRRYNIYNLEIYGNIQVTRWIKEYGFSNKNKKNLASVAQLVS